MPNDREVIRFYGTPSQGTFHRVAKIQDAEVYEPVKSLKDLFAHTDPSKVIDPAKFNAALDAIYQEGGSPEYVVDSQGNTIVPGNKSGLDGAMVEDDTPGPDLFPNTGRNTPYEEGQYGMFRRRAGHRKAVARCLRALRPIADTFDALYVTGLSGSVPAAVVAYIMKKDLLILRKADKNHNTLSHGYRLEGMDGPHRYMILDDFCSTATTLQNLLKFYPNRSTLVGVMLYGHPRAKSEIRDGYAKTFVHEVDEKTSIHYHLVRRGKNSMVFDLVEMERITSVKD